MFRENPGFNVNSSREKEMEDYMRQCMRKLALWHAKTFKPIMTHDELEPIMSIRGFVGQPPMMAENGVVWKEYVYAGKVGGFCYSSLLVGEENEDRVGKANHNEVSNLLPPKPKLPYPRIDGLHIYTYRAFIDAVEFFLGPFDVSDLFHIRGMPLHQAYDRNKKYRRMCEEESIFVYRDGTLDPSTLTLCRDQDYIDDNDNNLRHDNCFGETNIYYNSNVIRNKGADIVIGKHVPLEDIITCMHDASYMS